MPALAHALARTSALALVAGVLALGTSVAPSPAHAALAAQAAPAAPAAPATDPGPGASAKAQLAAAEAADPGEISGTIQDAQANPVDGVTVQADEQVADENGDPSWSLDEYESYSSDGSYAITLPAGTWRLSFLPDDSESYDGVTTPPFTTPGADLADPIVLPSAGHQTVTGTVVGTGGGGIAGATVSLYWLHGEPGAWTESENVDQTTTDAVGGYTFPGVRTHRFYAVEVSATGYHPVVGGTTGDDPLAAPGVEVTGDTTVDPIALSPASTLSGTVSGPSGPDPNAEVELYRWYDDGDGETGWGNVADVGVDSAGHYAFASLEDAATYTLHVLANDEDLNDTWLGGGLREPSTPTAANSFETSGVAALVRDVALTRAAVVTGTVTDQGGQPLAGATVVGYTWDGTTWEQRDTGTTAGDDGTFSFRSPAGSTATFRASQPGYQTTFYGGGTALPAAPSATNSFTVHDAGASTGTLALPPFHSALGKVAGQDLAYCRSNALAANDDESSDAVDLPFPLKFFGTPYTRLWVNNNGNVTFNGPLSTYTPEDISSDTGLPIIAPFFADVDTEGAGSQLVSYGTSPDGHSLCVDWADVGYYSAHDDLLNTFQLILTKDDTGAGRSAGDFDITFNYDQVSWETGDASEGMNGVGGTSALAGFSAGTGAPGTFVVLPGSLDNGALLDGGPDALVAGKQASQQTGRYVFPVLNQGQTSALGGLSGTVTKASDHTGVAGAYVQACTAAGGCSYTDTGADGGYSFSALLQGAYAITVWPPDDSLFSGGTSASVTGGQTTTGADVALAAPQPMPPNVALSNNGLSGGVPSVYYGDPTTFTMTGCPGVANPTYTVTLVDGTAVAHGALVESPSGTYSATIPPFYPQHGDALFTTNVPSRCGGAGTTFNLYIDPSGVVTDQYGRPIGGATVTLSRSDTSTGTFTDVPDGSDLMSASNRRNPDTTDDRGQFAWEVEAGWYEVAATAPGCDPASTPAMQVPPAQIDLALKLTCAVDAPRPTAAPTITGTPRAGQALQVTRATWAAPIATTGTALMRRLGSGPATRVALRNGRYTLTAGDVGATFYATSTGRRPDVVPPEFAAGTVSFDQVSAESRHVVVAAGSSGGTHTAKPAASAVTLKVKPKKPRHTKKVTVVVRVSAATTVTGTVRLYDGQKAIGKVVTLRGGRAVIKLKLKKGKHHLTAVFAGSATAAASSSRAVKVKVR